MARQRLLQWYHNYALIMGVTSYRLVAGRFRQTWITRSYTLALNTVQLIFLYPIIWRSVHYLEAVNWFPHLIMITTYIFYAVSSVAIVYTIISRGYRDRALREVEILVSRLKQQETSRFGITDDVKTSLNFIFYLKFGTMLFLCISSWLAFLIMPDDRRRFAIFCSLFLSHAVNIPIVAAHRYFLVLWDIACGFQYINCRLDHLNRLKQKRLPTRMELKEFHRLWLLHSVLSRCILRMNKIYEFLLLAARFDYVTFTVIDGYWGILFCFATKTPLTVLVYGAISYLVRSLDFFVFDVMCDLTVQYQNRAHHTVSQGPWYKELNAFLLYASTSKMSLSVCGLYNVNRKCWFQMMGSILSLLIVLLQFHLHLRDKYSL